MAGYTVITWTAGDTITEAKLDAMVANDQSEDAHAANGYVLNNNVAFSIKDVGGTTRTAIKLDTSDYLVIGDTTHIDQIQLKTAGKILINDTANTKSTRGLTINQGASDDEIFSGKSSDVAHGMTDNAETDTYGVLKKVYGDAGGLAVIGYRDADGANNGALQLVGNLGEAANATKSTLGLGVVNIIGNIKSGTGTGAIGANGNIAAFRNAGTTRFILDGDGDSHQDVGTAWTNFDGFQDINLLTALSVGVSQMSDPIRERFNHILEENREILEKNKLVTFNDNGHHFINWSRTNMLMIGAIRQIGDRLKKCEDALLDAGIDLKLL